MVLRSRGLITLAKTFTFPIFILVVFAFFVSLEPGIASGRNLVNIISQSTYLIIFALAQTVILVPHGFDLSLGNAVSFTSVATALVLTSGFGLGLSGAEVIILGIAVGLACGLAVGFFNGIFSSYFGIGSFIVTLGSMNICYGLAASISGGRPVFNVPDAFTTFFYGGKIFGVPAPVLITIIVAALVHVVLSRTVFGRALYLIGCNPRAVEVAGLPRKRFYALAFCLSGALVAIGALMLTARTGTGEPNLGGSLLLQAIAAAVIGGVSLSGGRGGVFHAVFGALFITVLSNGLNFLQISGYLQQITLGVVIIVAIALDRSRG
jgi:ribose transport system permease protein